MQRTPSDNVYTALVRSDYLNELQKLSRGTKERDALIVAAVEWFMDSVPPWKRQLEIDLEKPRGRISFPEGVTPQYEKPFVIIDFPDELFERMDQENRDEYTGTPFCSDPETILNAAIRVYLEKEGKLEPLRSEKK